MIRRISVLCILSFGLLSACQKQLLAPWSKPSNSTSSSSTGGSDKTVEGVLQVVQIDDFKNPENNKLEFSVIQNGTNKVIPFVPAAESQNFIKRSGTPVRLKLNDAARMTYSVQSLVSVREALSVKVNENHGSQRTLIIVASSKNSVMGNSSFNLIYDRVFSYMPNSVADFYSKASYGQASIVPAGRGIVGPYKIDNTCPTNGNEEASYSYSAGGAALQAALNDPNSGINWNEVDRLITFIPDCNVRSLGTIGKIPINTPAGRKTMSRSWVHMDWDSMASDATKRDRYFLYIFAHEMGHNFGASHANQAWCEDDRFFSGSCSSSEYYDEYDIMGGWTYPRFLHNPAPFNGLHREQFGWIEDTREISQAGEYDIAIVALEGQPRPFKDSHVRIVQPIAPLFAPHDFDNTYLSIQYRTDGGFSPVFQPGVYLNMGTPALDVFGGVMPSFAINNDNPLRKVGDVYDDTTNGIHLRVTSIGPTEVWLRVRIDKNLAFLPPAQNLNYDSTNKVFSWAPPSGLLPGENVRSYQLVLTNGDGGVIPAGVGPTPTSYSIAGNRDVQGGGHLFSMTTETTFGRKSYAQIPSFIYTDPWVRRYKEKGYVYELDTCEPDLVAYNVAADGSKHRAGEFTCWRDTDPAHTCRVEFGIIHVRSCYIDPQGVKHDYGCGDCPP